MALRGSVMENGVLQWIHFLLDRMLGMYTFHCVRSSDGASTDVYAYSLIECEC